MRNIEQIRVYVWVIAGDLFYCDCIFRVEGEENGVSVIFEGNRVVDNFLELVKDVKLQILEVL